MTSATYAGTTGHSGTDTSRAQADDLPKHGRARVLRSAANLGYQGVTIVDLRSWFDDMHHGTLSSALTNLHRDGRLARLVEKRDRCHIYVLPEYVTGRPTEPWGAGLCPNSTTSTTSGHGRRATTWAGRKAKPEVAGKHPSPSSNTSTRCAQPWATPKRPTPTPAGSGTSPAP
jgi:hypothetical protein